MTKNSNIPYGRVKTDDLPRTNEIERRSVIHFRTFYKIGVCCGIFLMISFFSLLRYENSTYQNPDTLRYYQFEEYQRNYKDSFIVNTPGCRILNFAPFEFDLIQFFINGPGPDIRKCDKTKKGELVKATTRQIYINHEVATNFTTQQFSCCYRPFKRKTADSTYNKSNVDFLVEYSPQCFKFDEKTTVHSHFVVAECKTGLGVQIYKDFFTFAVEQKLFDQLTEVPINNSDSFPKIDIIENDNQDSENKFNVLILGFDGISRLNFIREMPRTADFLEENGGITLLGYNKVGYNTFPNLVPILTGMDTHELRNSCWPTQNTVFDKCKFIWDIYKDNGYYTAYGEDHPFISTFSYQKRGFKKQPVDYYLKPYFSECEKHLDVLALNGVSSIVCVGNKENLIRFENAFRGFASNTKHLSTFGLFWFNGLSHDHMNYARVGDQVFRSTFDSLKAEGALDNTVLIVMSDHGIRWGAFRKTFQGFLEERLPLATIVLPERFKRLYPQAVKTLEINAKRLSVPFDFYETLLDIVHHRLPTNSHDNMNRHKVRGMSLFYPIDPRRTCIDAGVPMEWCACSELRQVPVNLPLSQIIAYEVVTTINSKLENTSQCAIHQLRTVTGLWMDVPEARDENANTLERDYIISIITVPGNAVFEARVRHRKPDDYSVEGVISRLNMYHDTSDCVSDETLKLYCFCLDKIKTAKIPKEKFDINDKYFLHLLRRTFPPQQKVINSTVIPKLDGTNTQYLTLKRNKQPTQTNKLPNELTT